MRRTIRFWWKKGALHLMSNCNALIKRNFPGIPFLEEMRRILYFRWKKGVLHLRTKEKRSRFSCWEVYLILMPDIHEAKCFEFTVQILPPPLYRSS